VTPEAPLYERDPGAWETYLAEGNAKQARKRVGADVFLRDGEGRLLLVDPMWRRVQAALDGLNKGRVQYLDGNRAGF
jgi:hypothetical protein